MPVDSPIIKLDFTVGFAFTTLITVNGSQGVPKAFTRSNLAGTLLIGAVTTNTTIPLRLFRDTSAIADGWAQEFLDTGEIRLVVGSDELVLSASGFNWVADGAELRAWLARRSSGDALTVILDPKLPRLLLLEPAAPSISVVARAFSKSAAVLEVPSPLIEVQPPVVIETPAPTITAVAKAFSKPTIEVDVPAPELEVSFGFLVVPPPIIDITARAFSKPKAVVEPPAPLIEVQPPVIVEASAPVINAVARAFSKPTIEVDVTAPFVLTDIAAFSKPSVALNTLAPTINATGTNIPFNTLATALATTAPIIEAVAKAFSKPGFNIDVPEPAIEMSLVTLVPMGATNLEVEVKAAGNLLTWMSPRAPPGNPIIGYKIEVSLPQFLQFDLKDGQGYERIFACHDKPTLGVDKYPLDTWRYDQPETRNEVEWFDDAPQLTEECPYLYHSARRVPGIPEVGTSPFDAEDRLKPGWSGWSPPVVIGRWATDGEDGEEGVGVEYIFTSSDTGLPITGNANLPLASWDYDIDGLAAGIKRGAHTYYDGSPADLSATRPYQIRFHRAVPGSPAKNEDIGDIAWIQETAARIWGQKGEDGEEGVGVEYIFTSSRDGSAITDRASLPLASWDYDIDGLAAGITRGAHTYYDGSPANLSATRPYQIRFHRAVPGSPAKNEDIGDIAWIQEAAVRVQGQKGEDGEEGVGVEYIFTSSDTGLPITGNANLPLASWDYDIDGLAAGITRGAHTYYDGSPADLSATRPYQIRFHRAVPGSPAKNEDIGDIAWIQEAAVRVQGQKGEDGEEGVGVEYIFTSSDTGLPITGNANLPLASWDYDIDGLAAGIKRGAHTYYDGSPADLSATRPYQIRFHRAVPGSPAKNEDIGDIAWIQEAATYAWGKDGTPGVHARESLYTVHNTDSLPNNQLPLNSWGYLNGGTREGKRWTTAPQATTEANPYRVSVSRQPRPGPLEKGDAVYDPAYAETAWSAPVYDKLFSDTTGNVQEILLDLVRGAIVAAARDYTSSNVIRDTYREIFDVAFKIPDTASTPLIIQVYFGGDISPTGSDQVHCQARVTVDGVAREYAQRTLDEEDDLYGTFVFVFPKKIQAELVPVKVEVKTYESGSRRTMNLRNAYVSAQIMPSTTATDITGAAPLAVTISPTTIDAGDTLDGVATGGVGTYKYQWQSRASASGSWSNIASATSSSYTVPASGSGSAQGYQYRLVVMDGIGASKASDPATISVALTVSRTFYRRASSAPSKPATTHDVGRTAASAPSGWQTTRPSPTATLGVYSVTGTSSYANNVFQSTVWGAVTLVDAPSVTVSRTFYRRASSAPSKPATTHDVGRTAASAPSGWQTTRPSPTATLGVYSVTGTSSYINNVFQSTVWGAVTRVNAPVTNTTYQSRTFYQRSTSSSRPASPATTHDVGRTTASAPSGWSTSSLSANPSSFVYVITGRSAYINNVFQSTVWTFGSRRQPSLPSWTSEPSNITPQTNPPAVVNTSNWASLSFAVHIANETGCRISASGAPLGTVTITESSCVFVSTPWTRVGTVTIRVTPYNIRGNGPSRTITIAVIASATDTAGTASISGFSSNRANGGTARATLTDPDSPSNIRYQWYETLSAGSEITAGRFRSEGYVGGKFPTIKLRVVITYDDNFGNNKTVSASVSR